MLKINKIISIRNLNKKTPLTLLNILLPDFIMPLSEENPLLKNINISADNICRTNTSD
jgi:hypothetical protein